MKHVKPFNRKAKALARKNDTDYMGLACGVCSASFAPGWEVGSGGDVDPCPWQNDLNLCYVTCFWTMQIPDDNLYPTWMDACQNLIYDWMNLCVVPD